MSIYKDALRYRWIRDTQAKPSRDLEEDGAVDSLFIWNGDGSATALTDHEFDEAIDSAMERWPEDEEKRQDKFKKVYDALYGLQYDRDVTHLVTMSLPLTKQTKYISDSDTRYIVDGLNYEGSFGRDWEGRAEFTFRFLDTLIDRGNGLLLFNAAIEAFARGKDYNHEFDFQANQSYNDWVQAKYKEDLQRRSYTVTGRGETK